jgi:hypothetical protein
MIGAKSLADQIKDGTAKVEGDVSILARLAAAMVEFDPRFEVLPGTKQLGPLAAADPYEAQVGKIIAE